MKKCLQVIFGLAVIVTNAQNSSQNIRQCATNENLEIFLKNNPRYKDTLATFENKIKTWIDQNGRGIKKLDFKNPISKSNVSNQKSAFFTNDICSYDNQFFTLINAPTTSNEIVTPTPNCVFGGEYVRVNGLIGGNTYRISTIGQENFDTTITIYTENGTEVVAYNDDFNGTLQSEIYFTPFISGNYDILIDEIGCISNTLCSILEVELWYEPRPVITIPVVVHVMHNGEDVGQGANLSDEQIQSQITALNEDFRRLSDELNNTSAAFKGGSGDTLIEFCLARRAQDGSSTNGIDRIEIQPLLDLIISDPAIGLPTNLQCLNRVTMEIAKAETIWNRDEYLNIWVSDALQQSTDTNGNNVPGCESSAGTLGYAQFPEMGGLIQGLDPALTDGIWVRNDVFGTIGNIDSFYNKGKTTTHEVGHWLNLKHIWGDDQNLEDKCSMDDDIVDTPLQAVATSECPQFPITDQCSTIFPGIMFNNFMDYSYDECLSMFTFSQTARIDATLFTSRISLLNSLGCESSTLNNDNVNLADKLKLYPNPTRDFINIEMQKFEADKLIIYSLLGQKLFEQEILDTKSIKLDLSSFKKGTYILELSNKFNKQNVKVIRN